LIESSQEEWRCVVKIVSRFSRVTNVGRRGGEVKCFERELGAAGGLSFRVDLGVRAIPTAKIVGSVGRCHELRRDFFYKNLPASSERYQRIGKAMREERPLPAIEVYELRTPRALAPGSGTGSEYYVVDGHHRVALAKKLGRDFIDARVVLYRASQRQLAA
jgi:hypothetical protein